MIKSKLFCLNLKKLIPTKKFIFISFLSVATLCNLNAQTQDRILIESVQNILKTNPEIERARQDLFLAELEEPGLEANTDPQFSASFFKTEDWSPTIEPSIAGTRSLSEKTEITYRQRSLIGTQIQAWLSNQRTDNDASFRLENTLYNKTLGLNLRQALLKNAWGRPDKSLRLRARKRVQSAQYKLQFISEQIAFEFSQNYLELQFARAYIEIKKAKQKNLQRLLKKQQEKNSYGLNETSDILQTQTALSLANLELESAQTTLKIAQNNLQSFQADFKNVDVSTTIFQIEFIDDKKPEDFVQHRLDIKALQSEKESLQASLRLDQLDFFPSLDFVAKVQNSSLNGQTHQATEELFKQSKPLYWFGLEITFALGNKKERNALQVTQTRLNNINALNESNRLKIVAEIKNRKENYQLTCLRLKALQQILKLQEKKLNAEQQLFLRGRSNTDVLIRFENDLNQTQSDVLRALIDQNKAALALSLSCANLSKTLEISK